MRGRKNRPPPDLEAAREVTPNPFRAPSRPPKPIPASGAETSEAAMKLLAYEAEAARSVEDALAPLFPPEYVSPTTAQRLRDLAAELARRRMEALNLYEPLPAQAQFHDSGVRVRLLRGSNRGGKTLPAA